MITNDRDYWREQSGIERARADALQRELYEVRDEADHAVDIAQAAMLAFNERKAAQHGTD